MHWWCSRTDITCLSYRSYTLCTNFMTWDRGDLLVIIVIYCYEIWIKILDWWLVRVILTSHKWTLIRGFVALSWWVSSFIVIIDLSSLFSYFTLVTISKHSECLTSSSLTVHKDCTINTFQRAFYNIFACLWIDLLVRGIIIKTFVYNNAKG